MNAEAVFLLCGGHSDNEFPLGDNSGSGDVSWLEDSFLALRRWRGAER